MTTQNQDSLFESLAARLRSSAIATNEIFDRTKRWRRALRSQLRQLKKIVSAADVLLFQVSTRQSSDQVVRLLSRVTKNHSGQESLNSERFSFRLLPAEIQNGLSNQTVIQLSTDDGTGGRLLQQMQCGVDGNKVMMIPVYRRDNKLNGLLVLIFQEDPFAQFDERQADRFTSLLQLSGTLLLGNVRRKKKLARQQKQMQQWKQIADYACDFALQTDAQLVITDVIPFGSPTACPAVHGLRLTDIVERTFHRRVKQQIDLALEHGNVRTIDFRIVLGADGAVWYHARIEPRVSFLGKGCMLYLTDNTHDKRLQSEINQLNDRLVRASRLSLLGQMSTEFAHQINQPLQAILGFASLTLKRIRKGSNTPKQTLAAMQQIETSVTHSVNIIESIRNFARYRALKVRRVSVASLINDAMMMVAERASRLRAEFSVHSVPDDCDVMADRTQTTHVFINLIVNALEATSEFGINQPLISIFVVDQDDPNRVVVAVKDNGPGLPLDDTDQVFEKFHSRKKDGLGLGLAMSRDVCETQRGSLNAYNNLDEAGCTFWVSFQVATDDDDTDAEEQAEAAFQTAEESGSHW